MGANGSESVSISSSSVAWSCWGADILWGVSKGDGVVSGLVWSVKPVCTHLWVVRSLSVVGSIFVWFSLVYARAHANDGIVWPPGKVHIQFEKPGITT